MGVSKDNKQSTLVEILEENLARKNKTVAVVNMDMDKRIKGAVRQVFPDVPIVADKFHVIKFTNRVIDLCRVAVEKSVRDRFEIKRILVMKTGKFHYLKHKDKWKVKAQKLEQVLKEYPEIKLLWDLKNKVHGFYRCKTLETATQSWKALLSFLKQHKALHPEFTDLKKTFLNWETEILNYFIYRTTNAYIEGLNNRIETFKRKRWGFRNKESFIKCLCYMLFPISHVFQSHIYTHWF